MGYTRDDLTKIELWSWPFYRIHSLAFIAFTSTPASSIVGFHRLIVFR